MADLADVEKAIVSAVAAILFPGVSYQPGAKTASVPGGLTIKLFRGWPIAADLDADLLAGQAQVSVWPETGLARNTSRYLPAWCDATAPTPTLTAAAAGNAVTFGGTGAVGEVAGVTVGATDDPAAYAYRLQAGDGPAQVAAAFAAAIDGASAAGAVLTLPGPAGARVVADGSAQKVTRMQQQAIRVTVWAHSPAARDALAGLIDAGLSDLPRVDLADGAVARLVWRMGASIDATQKERLWRRDIGLMAEFPTVRTETTPAMLFGTLGVGVSVSAGIGVPEAGDMILQFGPAGPPPDALLMDADTGEYLLDATGTGLAEVPA